MMVGGTGMARHLLCPVLSARFHMISDIKGFTYLFSYHYHVVGLCFQIGCMMVDGTGMVRPLS